MSQRYTGGIVSAGLNGINWPPPTTVEYLVVAGGGGGGRRTSTRSGGGGCSAGTAGAGGSGIVIIRYPAYLAPAKLTTGSPETYVTGQWRVYKWIASGTITF